MANLSQQAEAVVAALEQASGQGYADRPVMVETVLKTLTAHAATMASHKKPGPVKGSVPKVSAFRVFQTEALKHWVELKAEAEAAKQPIPNYPAWMKENISNPWAAIKADKERLAEFQKLADLANAAPVPVPVSN